MVKVHSRHLRWALQESSSRGRQNRIVGPVRPPRAVHTSLVRSISAAIPHQRVLRSDPNCAVEADPLISRETAEVVALAPVHSVSVHSSRTWAKRSMLYRLPSVVLLLDPSPSRNWFSNLFPERFSAMSAGSSARCSVQWPRFHLTPVFSVQPGWAHTGRLLPIAASLGLSAR